MRPACRFESATSPAAESCVRRPRTGDPPYTRRAMNVTASPAPKSSILLEIEVPADQFDRAVRDAVGRLSRRTRVAGFRPGKAPRPILERVLGPTAIVDEAVEHLVQDAYREAIIEQGIVPLTNADVEIVEAEEGKPLRFKATVQVRPEVQLGDYAQFNFAPEIETIDEPKVDKVVEELRDQNATARGGRGPRGEGRRLGRHRLRRHPGRHAVRGRPDRADAADPRRGPADPGLRGERRRPQAGRRRPSSTSRSPRTTRRRRSPASRSHFKVDLKELREKVLPDADDAFAQSMGDYADMAALKADIADAPRAQRARPGAPRVQRQDHRVRRRQRDDRAPRRAGRPGGRGDARRVPDELARQGIGEEAYLKATGQTEADLHTEFRPRAEQRTKVLLVLSKIAETEGIDVPDSRRRGPGRAGPASATRTRRRSATSSRSAAATSSAPRSAGRGSSRRSSTAGWRRIPTIRPCRTSRTTRRRPSTPPGRRPPPPSTPPIPGAIPGH